MTTTRHDTPYTPSRTDSPSRTESSSRYDSGASSRPDSAGGGGFRSDRPDRPGGPQRRQFFRRRKTCPFSGPKAVQIDYKDIRLLYKFVSEKGKIVPSRISAVSLKKQRELAVAIKRARFLALMPFLSE